MLPLCTIKQAERQVHQDITELEVGSILPDLEQKVLAASAIVYNYLKIEVPDFTSPSVSGDLYNIWTVTGVPYDVQMATLLILGELWENREAEDTHAFRSPSPLSDSVRALLHRYRDPALA